MRSISTMRGDAGETSLAGGIRVSKASLRIDACGHIDELSAALGFARSICDNADVRELAKTIQSELFKVASALATPRESPKEPVPITAAMVDALTSAVHRFEAIEGILADWSIAGELPTAAAFDVARTVCRRAERSVVRIAESGDTVSPAIVPYLNRLSDLLFVMARAVNHRLRVPEVEW